VWVVVFLDLEATAATSGIHIDSLELLDEAGSVVAAAKAPWDVREDAGAVSDEARKRGDFSELGTTPFDGKLVAGRKVRLRVHAPLDKRSDALKPAPVRFRMRIVGSNADAVSFEGALQGPWPTG